MSHVQVSKTIGNADVLVLTWQAATDSVVCTYRSYQIEALPACKMCGHNRTHTLSLHTVLTPTPCLHNQHSHFVSATTNPHFVLVWLQAVEQGFESLLREYNQVRDDVAQGLGFYGQLQEAVKTLHQEVGDYCLARSLIPPCHLLPELPALK